jgi:hypothetical protein
MDTHNPPLPITCPNLTSKGVIVHFSTTTPFIQAFERNGDETGLGIRRGIPTLSLREGGHHCHHILEFHI